MEAPTTDSGETCAEIPPIGANRVRDMTSHQVTAPDGRTLAVLEAGEPDGPAIVAHHGSPGSGRLFRTELESARERGLRLITYDRPGFGGSSPHEGRRVADAAADVAAILDALGVERFA